MAEPSSRKALLQIPCCICSEIPQETDIWNVEKEYWRDLVEGHAMGDQVHLLLMIPPKYSVSNTVGFLKGKSAIRIFREHLRVKRNFTGMHFWARGYCVSTVGLSSYHPLCGWLLILACQCGTQRNSSLKTVTYGHFGTAE